MNLERTNNGTAAGIGFIAASAVFAVIAVAVKLSLTIPAVDEDRGVERSKALQDMRAVEEVAINTPAVIDAPRGIVRLPIDSAIQMAVQAWKTPAAARADLKARAEKAAAELPKAPEKPSAFE